MTNYVKSTNFATKDALASGNPLKIVKGTEIDTEFNNIATAVATKADLNSPALVTPALGTPTSGTLTNCTGLPIDVGTTGTLPTNRGGTGLTSFTANGVVYASSTSALATGSELTFDGTNLGLGVTPSAWDSTYRILQIGGNPVVAGGQAPLIAGNAYYNGGWKYINAGPNNAAYYQVNQANGGNHAWYTAPSGTAGNAITFTQALTLDADRNLLLNGTSAGASSVGTFAIFNGTAPTGSVTNGIILYAEDVSSSSELKVRDEAGNVTTLSPHNFSLIPDGPSEDMAWAYYSEKDGKRINVDMLKLARMVEKLTGEKLVYES